MSGSEYMFRPRVKRRRQIARLWSIVFFITSFIGAAVLLVLMLRVLSEGWNWLTADFLSNFPSNLNPKIAGIKSALHGTIWLITLTGLISVPLGVGAAVYLEEYAANNRITRFIKLNIANLAGVPSIVYGILGLAMFVRTMSLDRSVISGALTMSLLILPVIIIASREGLAAVPKSVRLAAYALGATRWQVIWSHVLPAALPGIVTGVILAVSRAIGEAAPLLMIGALTYVAFVPEGLTDPFTALPMQIYDWVGRPQEQFHHLAAAGIIVLLSILLSLNAIAVGLRSWQQRKK